MIRHNSSLEQYVICELVLENYDSNIIQTSQDLVSESFRSSYAVIQPLSHFWLFLTPWTAEFQASLPFTVSQNLLKIMSIELVMLPNHLILRHSLLFCLQFFLASGSFPMGRLFASGGQTIGASASASVLPVDIQGWFPLGLTGLISFQVQGTLKSLLQHHSLKASILQSSTFFMVQLSTLYMTTGKAIASTIWTFLSKGFLLFNTRLGLS